MYWDLKDHSAREAPVPQPHMMNDDFPGSFAEIGEGHQQVGYYLLRILKMLPAGCGVDG